MNKTLLCSLLVAMSLTSYAQKDGIFTDLEKAIDHFNAAEDMAGMVEAAHMSKDLSDKNQDRWLPAYWTAFFYSQIGRQSEDQLTIYDTAQTYLDRAMAVKDFNNQMKSELFVLQSLINSLQSSPYWAKNDRTNGIKYATMQNQALDQAIKLNEDNPRVFLLTGTGLVGDGLRTRDPGYIMAGKIILGMAKEKYQEFPPASKIHPSWGEGWINFWLARAKLPESGD